MVRSLACSTVCVSQWVLTFVDLLNSTFVESQGSSYLWVLSLLDMRLLSVACLALGGGSAKMMKPSSGVGDVVLSDLCFFLSSKARSGMLVPVSLELYGRLRMQAHRHASHCLDVTVLWKTA